MSCRTTIGMAASVTVLLAAALAQPGRASAGPKANVRLLSSVDAIGPGKPFDVALHFQIAQGWHIYWHNSGDSGLPPGVKWSWPSGFSAGELQFPVPKRHVGAGNISTNILAGEPILLVRIMPPPVIDGDRVALTADVQYLACKDICVRESTKLTLELPVRPPGGEINATNEDLFRRARKAMPKESSKYVSVTAVTQPEELAPGKRFELVLNVNIKPGYHIQSHEPLSPSFIKCDVFLKRTNGVLFKSPIYPAPRFRSIKFVGKVSEYAGRITVRVPGEVDARAPRGPRRLGGLLTYQACDNKGTCFPPEALAFSTMAASLFEARAGATTGPPPVALVEQEATSDAASAPAQSAESGTETTTGADGLQGFLERFGLAGLLFACFLYGLFINATPCVLPLLSIKVLGFVQQAHESRGRTLMLGLTFGAGVMVFFVALGFLASAGKNVLQYPAAVIALGAVVMALALSMLGVYSLQVPAAATKLEASIQREGLLSSFGKGALAPVLGFACTGPLLAGAFGWATQQPPNIAVLAFVAAGLGMASPYVLLGANPHWLSFLPKPGMWMITFERIMGFLLLAMVIWLLHPLITHIGAEGLEWTLGFLVAIAMACWLLGKIDMRMSGLQRWRYRGSAAALVAGAGVFIYGWMYPLDEARARQQTFRLATQSDGHGSASGIDWQPWSPEQVERTVRSGKTVFVDFTAAYCTNCKVNKAVAINQPEFLEKLKTMGVVAFQGDFTSGDERILETLRKYGRFGVPLDLIYPAGKPDAPLVLRPLLTKSYLLQKLDEAASSRTTATATTGF